MQRLEKIGTLASALLMVAGLAPAANAHAITFPIAHHSVSHSAFLGYKLPSGAQRTYSNVLKTVITSQYKLGTKNFVGGTVTGGSITGTLYQNVNQGDSTTFTRTGPFTFTFGSGGPANTLSFAPNGFHPSGPILVTHMLGQRLTGSQSAFFSSYVTAGNGAYVSGLSSFHSLSGGILNGTNYILNSGTTFSADTNYLLAFGNSPYNTGAFANIVLPNSSSFFTFGNGLTKTLSNGFLVTRNFGLATAANNFLNTHVGRFYTFPTTPTTSFLLF